MPEVDLWLFPLDLDRDHLEQLWSLLSPEERQRALKREGILRDRFVAGWGQVRLCLAAYLSSPPAQLAIVRGRYGKPYLLNPANVTFNLSHSQNWLVLAVTRHVQIGVDLEHQSGRDFHRLAGRVLTSEEKRYLFGLPPEAQLEAFYRFWTLKEAVVKADGRGLWVGLHQIGLDLTRCPPQLVKSPPSLNAYPLWEGNFRDFRIGVACERTAGPLRLRLQVRSPLQTTSTGKPRPQGRQEEPAQHRSPPGGRDRPRLTEQAKHRRRETPHFLRFQIP